MSTVIDGSAGITTNAGGSVNPSTNVDGINYSCRAWVNFDGTKDTTGAVSTANTNRLIRASGNVTSVLRNGTGDYTITFTTAMTDANYATITTSLSGYADSGGGAYSQTTTQTKARSVASTTGILLDSALISVAIFR